MFWVEPKGNLAERLRKEVVRLAIVFKKQPGESVQQLLNTFRREMMDDPGLERVKEREMQGYQKPSKIRNEASKLRRKESARLRRRSKRARGILK